MPDVSVVVVHWNVPALLERCLASIAAERDRTSLAVETLVVDCASPDDGWRAVVEMAGARSLALVENRGYAAGCNAGVAATSGDAVLLLNPDTELLPGALPALLAGLAVAPHVAMAAPLLLNTDGSLQSAGYRFPGVANVFLDLFPLHPRLVESPLNGRMPASDLVQPVRVDYALGAALLVRRAALERVGGLDESYGMYAEEIDLARRLDALGLTTLLIPAARVVHHGGQSTRQRPEAMHAALWEARARYLTRWGTPRERRLANALVRVATRREDRRATPERRATNARIRAAFAAVLERRS